MSEIRCPLLPAGWRAAVEDLRDLDVGASADTPLTLNAARMSSACVLNVASPE